MSARLKIALVSAADPRDRRTWSGSTYFMGRALERHVGDVDYLGPLTVPAQFFKQQAARWLLRLFGRRRYPTRTLEAARFFAAKIGPQLAAGRYDLIFAPAASVEIAELATDVPIVYTSDATFALMQEVYPIFSSLTPGALRLETHFERTALAKAALIVYPSAWAARSAMTGYGTAEEKIRVIPFGANLDREPPREAVVGKRNDGRLRLLFLAKEWARKGGPIAFATLSALERRGIAAELTVCGVTPPQEFAHPHLQVVPYLDKNVPAQRQRFEQILVDAHLLLLPTRAECYGIVFCEANAYGLPVFGTRVGGIPTIVADGVNGYLLPTAADGDAFAASIAAHALEPAAYAALNRGARDRYETVLNWNAWGQTLRQAITDVIGR